MKLIILIIFTIVFKSNCAFSQNPFYDALKLEKRFLVGQDTFKNGDSVFIVIPDIDSVYLILGNYVKDTSSKNTIVAGFIDNPFLRPSRSLVQGSLKGIFAKELKSIGGLDVTKYANAIADLMIERAKQELSVAFFNRFQRFAKDNMEFHILFPKTTDNLSNLLTYAYPQMLPALRKGFFQDLKKITYNLDDVLELPRYRHLLNNFPEVRIAIRSIRLVHNLEDGTSTAADLIKDLGNLNEWNEKGSNDFENIKATVKLASIFSESLRSKDNSEIWVSVKEIKESIKDEIFVKIYMGLLYQQIKNSSIKFIINQNGSVVTENLTDILTQQKDNIILFQNKLSEFGDLSNNVRNAYKTLKPKIDIKTKISNEDIYNYINVSIDITDYALSIVKIFKEELVTDKYLTIVKKSNELYKDIYSEEYTQAVNDAIDILKQVHDLTKNNTTDSRAFIAKSSFAKDKDIVLDTMLTFVEKLKPYALFMANMVEAKDEAAIKASLDNVILPVGSSSIKKFTRGNISVQSYLGAFLSTSTKRNILDGAWSDRFGVTAPIGISWTPGIFSWEKGGSLSLFTALIDLGAIVDYKLKKESNPTSSDPNATVISKDYKIQLGQIFSPGIYAVYGLGANIPLSLGFGAQYGPGLSKIDVGNNTVITNPSWRWNLFLAVDLPFFNLVNRPKKQ